MVVALGSKKRVDRYVRTAVGNTSDGCAEVRAIVGLVVLLGSKALDDIMAGDWEGLEDGAEREKGDFVFGGHLDCWCISEADLDFLQETLLPLRISRGDRKI